MPASADRIQREVDEHIEPTARDKGLTLSIEVSAMDTGMFRVYNIPMSPHGPVFDDEAGVQAACEHAANLIKELHRRAIERRADHQL